jgi:hypothetical protein
VAVAAALSITQIIVVPLAAVCILAPAILQLRERGRDSLRPLAIRIGVAAIPLALWVLSNLYRYHWLTPRSANAGPGYAASTKALDLQTFATTWYLSFTDSIKEPFHWWFATPYAYDYRPLVVFVPITFIVIARVMMRGTEIQRQAIGLWLYGFMAANISVFLMLYLAVVTTGGGDFVFRYFTAEHAAAACLAGTCFGVLFRRPALQRSAALIGAVALTYWTYQASPL